MKEFRLEVDTTTIYIKAIRFVGALFMGALIGVSTYKYVNGIDIELLPLVNGLIFATIFSFFPGGLGARSLHINENGLFLYPLNSKSESLYNYWGTVDNFSWERVKSIALKGRHIWIFPNRGSSKKIPLPLYTKEQWTELEEYLREAAEFNGIKFSN